MQLANPPLEPGAAQEFRRSGAYRTTTIPRDGELPRPDGNATSSPRSGLVVSWPLAAAMLVVTVTAAVQPWKWGARGSESGVPTDSRRWVQIAHPTVASKLDVTLPGTLQPWQTASLHARVNGYVKAWHYDLGATVRTGDLLAEIDTPELDQELAQAEGLASEAEAAVAQARTERIEAEADLNVAESQRDRAQAEWNLARSQLVRREQLLARKVIVQEEYDTALREAETRAADVAATNSDVARRRANLRTRDAIIASRESTAQSRRANVQRLKELQSFQRIVAPFDGVITKRTAEVGMLVAPDSEPLFVLDDMSRIRVQVQVPQSYSAAVHVGLAAAVRLPESLTPGVAGSVTRIANAVDVASRTMLAEIELPNEAHRLQPGSYAQVTMNVPQQAGAWTIPTNTISMRVDGPHVVVVDASDRTELRRVTLGRDLGTQVVVTDGIRGGERLVVNPTDDLANGEAIRIATADKQHLAAHGDSDHRHEL